MTSEILPNQFTPTDKEARLVLAGKRVEAVEAWVERTGGGFHSGPTLLLQAAAKLLVKHVQAGNNLDAYQRTEYLTEALSLLLESL